MDVLDREVEIHVDAPGDLGEKALSVFEKIKEISSLPDLKPFSAYTALQCIYQFGYEISHTADEKYGTAFLHLATNKTVFMNEGGTLLNIYSFLLELLQDKSGDFEWSLLKPKDEVLYNKRERSE